ncbi:maternal effect protein staufen-like isoform X2 [Harmonia axyridis]|uniref:maternal effect protein staufen-like isoform X2 n=1 Tax=Harmonia axyridis TaxID=115357 RepID=UPI001E278890|nr:maternal effect protein staufen-like isoform X2 [Harmonia axyridis]
MSCIPLIILIFSQILLSSNAENDFNIEHLFRESHCIPQPTEDVFTDYLSKIQAQGEELFISAESTGTKDLNANRNYRSEVNLLVQYNKIDFSYKVEDEKATPDKIFNISLLLGDEIYYGIGKSKKEAKEMASKQALENTSYQKPNMKMKNHGSLDENLPPTVRLNNIGLKLGYLIQYYMVDVKLSKRIINLELMKDGFQFTNTTFWKVSANLDEPPKSPFNVEVYVEGKSFYGKAHSIQSAKHEAASKALKYLEEKGLDKNSVCTTKGYEVECEEVKGKLKSPISILYEYAMINRLNLEFNELKKLGPPHKPIFEMECVLGSEKVTARGKSKKETKRILSEKMLQKLPELDLSVGLYDDNTETHTSKLKKRKNNLVNSVAEVLGNIGNYFGSDDGVSGGNSNEFDDTGNDKSNKKKRKSNKNIESTWSPKEKLVESGKALNLNIKFYTVPKEKSGFYTLLSLDIDPSHICLGIGANSEISQEYAALNALKFLQRLDVLEAVEEDDLNIERVSAR